MRGRTTVKKLSEHPLRLFNAIPISQKTVVLFEWEIPILQKRAQQVSVEFKTKPDILFWDELSSVPVVLHWNLDHDDCPFLSRENYCLAQEQKPLGCQAFPLMVFGLIDTITRTEPLRIDLMDCPNTVPLPFEMERMIMVSSSTFFKETFRVYGSTFVGMIRLDAAARLLLESMKALMEKWIVYPGIIDESIAKSLREEKPIGLLDHLRKKQPSIAEDLEKNIKSIYEVDNIFFEKMIARRRRGKKQNRPV
jgi:Fe-S-cluster containining protein